MTRRQYDITAKRTFVREEVFTVYANSKEEAIEQFKADPYKHVFGWFMGDYEPEGGTLKIRSVRTLAKSEEEDWSLIPDEPAQEPAES